MEEYDNALRPSYNNLGERTLIRQDRKGNRTRIRRAHPLICNELLPCNFPLYQPIHGILNDL